MPASKLHAIHPRQSLRRLRTTWSPSSPPTSPSSTTTSSPRSVSTRASSRFSGLDFQFRNISTGSLFPKPDSRRIIRRKQSVAEMEQQEERNYFAEELVSLVEPRPHVGTSLGGIEEVLEGRI